MKCYENEDKSPASASDIRMHGCSAKLRLRYNWSQSVLQWSSDIRWKPCMLCDWSTVNKDPQQFRKATFSASHLQPIAPSYSRTWTQWAVAAEHSDDKTIVRTRDVEVQIKKSEGGHVERAACTWRSTAADADESGRQSVTAPPPSACAELQASWNRHARANAPCASPRSQSTHCTSATASSSR